MSQQFSTPASAQTGSQAPQTPQMPSAPALSPLLVHLAGYATLLILITAITRWVRRKRAAPQVTLASELADTQIDTQTLDSLRFAQPLQCLAYGKQLERAGLYEAALAVYESGLQDYSNDFRLWHERGLVLAKLQRFEAAIASYDQAYQINPRQRDLAHERGDALLQLGRYSEAIDSFDIYLKYDAHNPHILADRGYALMRLGCYEAALNSLEQVLNNNRWNRNAQIYARRYHIEALRQSGQLKAALESARIAMKQHPEAQFEAEYEALQRQLG
jgi:tetratricopeptide (TPR) repeat protein